MIRYIILISFILVLASCKKEIYNEPTSILKGTTWELYQYKDINSTQYFQRNDTLEFSEDFNYYYNQIYNEYSISNNPYHYTLIIKGTPFGDLCGSLPQNFLFYGEILDVEFTDLYSYRKYHLCLRKI